jgi:ketosteroid isomerase-like protein
MLNIKSVRTPSLIQHCEDDPRMSISQGTNMQSSTKCFLFKPLFLVVCFWPIAQAGGSGEHHQANTAFVTPVVSGQEKSDHQTQIDFGKLEEAVLAELKETNTPGAAIGIVKGDRLIFAKGFGVSNIETGAPVTPEMLFRLASVTKMFTAALVTLVEKGKVSDTRFTVMPVSLTRQQEIFFVMGTNGNTEFLHVSGRSYKKLPTSIDQGSAQNEGAETTADLALKEVKSAAEAFIKAFNNLDWEQFRNCFADDATVFFPSATMAAARANGRTEIEAIFKTLFDAARKRKDSPPYLNIEPKDTRIRVSGNAAVVTFHLGGKDSLGRRTVIFEKQKGKWLIVHLHASTMTL